MVLQRWLHMECRYYLYNKVMDIQKIVNELIEAISSDSPIDLILLKAQIVAFAIDNVDFTKFIKCEQAGYSPEDAIPDYRKISSRVQATFATPYFTTQTVIVPAELIKDKLIKDLMTFVSMRQPLIQLEAMYNNAKDSLVSVQLPAFAYPKIESLYKQNSQKVYSAYQQFPKETLLSIVCTFKSRLLQMLLQFDKELDWKLDLTTGQNRQTATTIINNIHAVIANTGSGNVDTKDINIEK